MATSGSGGSGEGNDRRYPRNLQGVLQFCLENTKAEDAPEARAAGPMDEERRKWLEEALANIRGPDPIKTIIANIQLIQSNAALEEKEEALENIQEWCEDLDIAKDFFQIGGHKALPVLLGDEEAGIRWRAADLVASLVQNNPVCQQRALDENLLPLLLRMLDQDADDQVRIKALYAVSCLSRDVEEARSVFEENDGFSVLIRAMQSEVKKLQVKAVFMLTAMCNAHPAYKDTLSELGMVEQLVSLLGREHCDTHEHIMNCLLTLVRNHDDSIQQCQREELELRSMLEQRIISLKDKEEFAEERVYATELMQICFSSGGTSVER